MDTSWESDFRERMHRFQSSREEGSTAVSIKVRATSGCFHKEHSPFAYKLIDAAAFRAEKIGANHQVEEHESGPEILAYLVATTAGLTFAKSIVDLLTAIIKARSEGVKTATDPPNLWN